VATCAPHPSAGVTFCPAKTIGMCGFVHVETKRSKAATTAQTYDHIPQPVKFSGTCRVMAAGRFPDGVQDFGRDWHAARLELSALCWRRLRGASHYRLRGNLDSVEQAMAEFTPAYQDNI
jgi:hypothetical protein